MRHHKFHDRRFPVLVLGCVVLSAYFAHHAIYGKYGVLARQRLMERAEVAERALAKAEVQRAALKRDVALLASEPPHPDLVAETAMAVLGYARPGDRWAPLRTR